MTLDEYQSAAERTINRSLSADDRLLDAAAGLAEEAGEVLGAVRKHRMQGRALDRDHLQEELGDALWCVAIAAQSAGFSLQDVARANVAKLRARWPDGL
ncbi:MAG TPA: nucleoside triphosphate pyrophosphohydrolase family protein [Gemmatimonadaceae bacterium]|nr:nucleoside triphosphate pyrophosphohydrolase family protein [Gemmatimonadaceae bacterium]